MRHSSQVYDIIFVIDLFSQCYGKAHFIVYKFLAGQQCAHRYDLLICIGYFYAYGTPARYGRYDTYAEGGEVELLAEGGGVGVGDQLEVVDAGQGGGRGVLVRRGGLHAQIAGVRPPDHP